MPALRAIQLPMQNGWQLIRKTRDLFRRSAPGTPGPNEGEEPFGDQDEQ